MGKQELERLDRVGHLGIAARIFTGVNHTRLEYTFLQCAVISLLPKFHKNDDQFALSGGVNIVGRSHKISSGEELLKCWALLGNYGHTYLTYGVERPIMQYARKHKALREILIDKSLPTDVKRWCKGVICEHRDSDFHFVLAFYRICQLPKGNRNKGLFIHILRNLVIPLAELRIEDPSQRYKLYRLRKAYEHVRLLCLVSLDAYYSHHPVRLQLSAAIVELHELLDSAKESGFLQLLYSTAGWLADELYFHPTALAVLRQYEIDAHDKLRQKYRRYLDDKAKFKGLFRNLLQSGFGKPKAGALRPLMRLSFDDHDFNKYRDSNLDVTKLKLQHQLVGSTAIKLSVVENSYTKRVHVDFFYKVEDCLPQNIATLYSRIYKWLAEALEDEFDNWVRRFAELPQDLRDETREIYLSDRINDYSSLLRSLFWSIISYLLPEDHHGVVEEFIRLNDRQSPILANFKYRDGGAFRGLVDHLDRTLKQNPSGLSTDRLHELEALRRVVSRSKSPLVIGCVEKFVVRDGANQSIDDWDGVVIEIGEGTLRVLIVEAKDQHKAPENKAFKQLLRTRDLVRKRHKFNSRRRRLAGLGALIEFRFT